MKIYTIVCFHGGFASREDTSVTGSFRTLYDARAALENEILERAQRDCLFSRTLWDDDNHEDIGDRLLGNSGREDADSFFHRYNDKCDFPEEIKTSLCRYLRDWILADPSYHIFSSAGYQTYHYDIIENELMEGMPK